MGTAAQIRRRFAEVGMKLVATTAAAFSNDRQRYLADGFDELICKPVHCEQVYQCTARLLGLDLLYAAPIQSDATTNIDARQAIALPLMRRLRTAAQLHQVTDFKAVLREIEENGRHTSPFFQRLRRHLHAYDMPSILRLLDEDINASQGAEVTT
jgi:CheY-like chemotaxis protein